MTKKAGIYLRVSTEGQTEGYGLDTQLERCEGMAKAKGWEIVDVYTDAGLSGSLSPAKRPAMNALLEDVKAGRIDAVIFYKLDRIGRDTQIILSIVGQLDQLNATLASCEESIDTSTPTGEFVLTVLAGLAKMDKDNTVRRLWGARRAKWRRGKTPNIGAMPFGYRVVGKGDDIRIEVDEDAADIVRFIFNRYSSGDATTYDIAEELTTKAILTPSERGGYRGPATGKKRGPTEWSPNTVNGILQNEAYTGVWRLHENSKYEDADPIEIKMPVIVEWDVFNRAAAVRQAHTAGPKNLKYDYLLGGRIKCNECGRMARSYSVKGGKGRRIRYYYYQCSVRQRKDGFKCISTTWPAGPTDDAVWEWLVQLLDPNELTHKLDAGMEALSIDAERISRRIDDLNRLIERKREELERLVAMSAHSSQLTAEIFKQQESAIADAIAGMQRERSDLEEEYDSLGIVPPGRQEELIAMAIAFTNRMDEDDGLSFEEKRRYIERFGVTARLAIQDGMKGVIASCTLVPDGEFILSNPPSWSNGPKDKLGWPTLTDFLPI